MKYPEASGREKNKLIVIPQVKSGEAEWKIFQMKIRFIMPKIANPATLTLVFFIKPGSTSAAVPIMDKSNVFCGESVSNRSKC